ncbi:glycosyltransferase [Flexivirga caeni]|uniref:4,4'-diaponeurosporenoate glycosyltransferase n=1 Tax=Flexivirga caeni TaxID=2294115 RepID=A0A3M9M8H7_9MICO|nr:glycosyltransferase [Flexivirga caeni]RNI21183.1 glycosyltransferase [Flexivirga caeni]
MTSTGSIIIPAHDEERVLGRLLTLLTAGRDATALHIVVVANGCTDKTADVARSFTGVRVIELAQGGKAGALNAGDLIADVFPRLYVDADVELGTDAAIATIQCLGQPGVLAARPPLRYSTDQCAPAVQRFYRARSRTTSLMSALWGAGIYGVSQTGRTRWESFPADRADDLFIDELFDPDDVRIVETDPVLVHVPRTTSALRHTLQRVYRAAAEPGEALPESRNGAASSLIDLVRANREPSQWADLATYVAIAASARSRRRRGNGPLPWERDDTSR